MGARQRGRQLPDDGSRQVVSDRLYQCHQRPDENQRSGQQGVGDACPKNGKVQVTGKGLVYTPAKGFKGSDSFCTKNTTPKAPGVVLSGCITVAVR